MSEIYHVDLGGYSGKGPTPLCGAVLRRPVAVESVPDRGRHCPLCQAKVQQAQQRILALGQVYEAFKKCGFVRAARR
jgi:hypothetical protein